MKRMSISAESVDSDIVGQFPLGDIDLTETFTSEFMDTFQLHLKLFLHSLDELLLTIIEHPSTQDHISCPSYVVIEIRDEFASISRDFQVPVQPSSAALRKFDVFTDVLKQYLALAPPGRTHVYKSDASWDLLNTKDLREKLISKIYGAEAFEFFHALDTVKDIVLELYALRPVAVVSVYESDDSWKSINYSNFRAHLRAELHTTWKSKCFRAEVESRLNTLISTLISFLTVQISGFYHVFERDKSWKLVNYKITRAAMRQRLKLVLKIKDEESF